MEYENWNTQNINNKIYWSPSFRQCPNDAGPENTWNRLHHLTRLLIAISPSRFNRIPSRYLWRRMRFIINMHGNMSIHWWQWHSHTISKSWIDIHCRCPVCLRAEKLNCIVNTGYLWMTNGNQKWPLKVSSLRSHYIHRVCASLRFSICSLCIRQTY